MDLYTSSTLNSCIVDLNYATLSGNNGGNCKTSVVNYVNWEMKLFVKFPFKVSQSQ